MTDLLQPNDQDINKAIKSRWNLYYEDLQYEKLKKAEIENQTKITYDKQEFIKGIVEILSKIDTETVQNSWKMYNTQIPDEYLEILKEDIEQDDELEKYNTPDINSFINLHYKKDKYSSENYEIVSDNGDNSNQDSESSSIDSQSNDEDEDNYFLSQHQNKQMEEDEENEEEKSSGKKQGDAIDVKKELIDLESLDDPLIQQIIASEKVINNVDSDGNYFYRAISKILTNTEDNWLNIKKFLLMVVYLQSGQIILSEDEINLNRSQFYEKYIQNSVWADIETQGLILSRLLKRKVLLWKGSIKPFKNPSRIYGEMDEYLNYPINIFYTGNHFQSMFILDDDQEKCQITNCCYSQLELLEVMVENYFDSQIFYSDQEHFDKTDEQFFQDVSFVQNSWQNVLQVFSTKFNYDFLSDVRQQPKKRHSKKVENMNSIPKNIFTQNKINIEGFKCCQYDKIYQKFQNREDCDYYNEKYKHLKSITPKKQLSQLWYPERISNIKDYKKRNRKMYKFRETLTNYKLLQCSIDQELRLAYVQNQKVKFILFKEQVEDFLDLFHGDIHRKRDKMIEVFNRLGVMFTDMRRLIQSKIDNCKVCQQENILRKRPATKQIMSTYPFERVQIDCCELHSSLHQKGLHQIIVIRDHFSRFSKVYAVKNKEAQTIRSNLLNFFNYGIPDILQSDNGKEFKNKLIEDLCDEYDINYIHGRPYHPQSQGSVERFNRWIHAKLIQVKLSQEDSFDLEQSIIQLCISYNNKKTRVTGQRPNDVIKLNKDDDAQKLDDILMKIQNSFPKNKNPLDFQVQNKALLSNRVESQKGKNSLVQKYSLKKKQGDLHLYNIPVTISKINQSNVSIIINKDTDNFVKGETYQCPTIFLKQVADECWQKFLDINDKEEDNNKLLDLDQLQDIQEEEEYFLTPRESFDEEYEEGQKQDSEDEEILQIQNKIKQL